MVYPTSKPAISGVLYLLLHIKHQREMPSQQKIRLPVRTAVSVTGHGALTSCVFPAPATAGP